MPPLLPKIEQDHHPHMDPMWSPGQYESLRADSADTDPDDTTADILPLPPPKKTKRPKQEPAQFTLEEELHIADWLLASDWLWKIGVSILFFILFICIDMFINFILLNNVPSLLSVYFACLHPIIN